MDWWFDMLVCSWDAPQGTKFSRQNVPDGKYGKVQFRAKLVKAVGTLTEYDLKNNATTPTIVSSQTVTMIAPVALSNGLCDGLYTLVVKDYAF